jgi:predicted dehydrogenase
MLRSTMYVAQLFREGKGWRYDPAVSGGGVLMTQNSHLLDMLLWMFGRVERVSAHTTQLYSRAVEDHAHVFFHFASGLRGFLDASWSAHHYRTPTMAIHVQGEGGTLDVTDDRVALFLSASGHGMDAGWHEWRKPDLYRGVPFDIGGSQYTRQAQQFLDAIRGAGVVESDVASALEVQRVISAVYLSAARQGAPVAPGAAA